MPPKVYVGPELAAYGFGQGHPFGPDRLEAFWDEAVRQGLDKQVEIGAPASADRLAIERFHTHEYVERVMRLSESGYGYLDAGDTPAFKEVFEAASTVVGSALAALATVMASQTRRCFVPIAGLHHARRNSAAGFCVFNDVGVLIETLRVEHGIRRIAYVDIDAHHGDGVFYAFEEDPDLCIADIHEDGHYLYPGTGFADETGRGAAAGTKLNLPMLPGADDSAFHRVWPLVEEHVSSFNPEIILLQCGADSIDGDPITHMRFSPAAHGAAAASLCAIADELCQGRIIGLGGGGYNRRNLAAGWCAVVREMCR